MEATTTASIPDSSNVKSPNKKAPKPLKRFKSFIKPDMKDSDE